MLAVFSRLTTARTGLQLVFPRFDTARTGLIAFSRFNAANISLFLLLSSWYFRGLLLRVLLIGSTKHVEALETASPGAYVVNSRILDA